MEQIINSIVSTWPHEIILVQECGQYLRACKMTGSECVDGTIRCSVFYVHTSSGTGTVHEMIVACQ